MKKAFWIGLIFLVVVALLCVIDSQTTSAKKSNSTYKTNSSSTTVKTINSTDNPTDNPTAKPTAIPTTQPTAKPTANSRVSFTNKYGTRTTICAHAGCSNYIATSGDTAYCTAHSKKCSSCGKYIDEDATYCMDCIKAATESALSKTTKKCVAENCSKQATKILTVVEPTGRTSSFSLCQSHYDQYKNHFNKQKGWSAY